MTGASQGDANEKELAPIDLRTPSVQRWWLFLVRSHVLGAIGAGEDALRPPSRRKLTRAIATARIEHGKRSFLRLLRAAERALPPGTKLPVGSADADPPSTRRGGG